MSSPEDVQELHNKVKHLLFDWTGGTRPLGTTEQYDVLEKQTVELMKLFKPFLQEAPPSLGIQFYKHKGTPVVKFIWDGDVSELFSGNGFSSTQAYVILQSHTDSKRTPKRVNKAIHKIIHNFIRRSSDY